MTENCHRSWDISIKATALVGALIAFIIVKWDLGNAEIARHAAETAKAEIEARLLNLDAEYRKDNDEIKKSIDALSADKLEHDVVLSRSQAEKTKKPLILVTPRLRLVHSYAAIREFQCELALKNVGEADANILTVRVNAIRGTAANDARKATELATLIENSKAAVETNPDSALDDINQFKRSVWDKRIEVERAEFPLGGLFFISPSSNHVRWEPIEGFSETRLQEMTLRSQQMVSDQFPILLLAPMGSQKLWYRLEIKVTLTDDSSQIFAYTIPAHAVFSQVAEAQMSYGGENRIFEWSPSAPLMPIEQKGPDTE